MPARELSDGRIVWFFGDTVRPRAAARRSSRTRCWSRRARASPSSSMHETGPVIPDARAGVVRWPMSVAVSRKDGRDSVIVLCSRIDRGDSGAFGFTFLGTSAAVFDGRRRRHSRS